MAVQPKGLVAGRTARMLAGLAAGVVLGIALVALLFGVAVVGALAGERSSGITDVVWVEYVELDGGGFEMSVSSGAGLLLLVAVCGACGALIGVARRRSPRATEEGAPRATGV